MTEEFSMFKIVKVLKEIAVEAQRVLVFSKQLWIISFTSTLQDLTMFLYKLLTLFFFNESQVYNYLYLQCFVVDFS